METHEETNDLIERYLMGKLSLWELAEIENKIRTEESFAEEVSLQRDILIGVTLRSRRVMKNTLKESEKRGRIFHLPFDLSDLIPYAIAACITLFIMGSVFYDSISNALTPNTKRIHYSLNVEE